MLLYILSAHEISTQIVSAILLNRFILCYAVNMTRSWQISKCYDGTEVARCFSTLDAVFTCPGEIVSQDLICSVKRVNIGDQSYYIKMYTAAGKRLRRYFGKSRLRTEWENFKTFKQLNIPTAEIVGFGIETKFGIFQRGALITKGIKNSTDLHHFAKNNPSLIRNRQWIVPVVEKVAHYTRIMHDAKFTHNDLNWRNILIDNAQPAEIYFIDCPSGGVSTPLFLKRLITRDLAHLDKLARTLLPKPLQLRFYLRYMGHQQLAEKDKIYIKKIIKFHGKHRRRKHRRSLSSQTINSPMKVKN